MATPYERINANEKSMAAAMTPIMIHSGRLQLLLGDVNKQAYGPYGPFTIISSLMGPEREQKKIPHGSQTVIHCASTLTLVEDVIDVIESLEAHTSNEPPTAESYNSVLYLIGWIGAQSGGALDLLHAIRHPAEDSGAEVAGHSAREWHWQRILKMRRKRLGPNPAPRLITEIEPILERARAVVSRKMREAEKRRA